MVCPILHCEASTGGTGRWGDLGTCYLGEVTRGVVRNVRATLPG